MALTDIRFQKAVTTLNEELRSTTSREEITTLVREHLQRVESEPKLQEVIKFPSNLKWFNVDSELSFSRQLKGKIVILDFFTYCCINCLHILPDLHRLEHCIQPEGGVVIVGVHSAKFPNERVDHNIKNALMKYNITHPVVNDAGIELWEGLGVSCWPTLVFVSPRGRVIHYIIGEGHAHEMNRFTDIALEYYRETDQLSSHPIPVALERDMLTTGQLLYPGKVIVQGDQLLLSDSGNHRILMVDRHSGRVMNTFGSGRAGLKDGKWKKAEFNSPQGVAYHEGRVYVADTQNHCIREIHLATGEVSTVLGTGCQGNDKEGGDKGVHQEISSPWDVVPMATPGSDGDNALCIATAGTHQLWAYFLKNSSWYNKSEYERSVAVRMSGSGEEANRNNSFPHKAAYAQPSGLTVDPRSKVVYVADSESSSIRCVTISNGSVKGVVGGGLDPMDLFAFGDKDGKGREARLQHPLGVAWDPHNAVLYIADTYNHKIKTCDPVKKTCSTLAGTGEPGLMDGGLSEAQFYEPGGICVTDEGRTLFVSDTNNNCIRKIDLESKTVEQFHILFQDNTATEDTDNATADRPHPLYTSIVGKRAKLVTHQQPISAPLGQSIVITVKLLVSKGYGLSREPQSNWQVVTPLPPGVAVQAGSSCGGGVTEDGRAIMRLSLPQEAPDFTLKVELLVYYCSAGGDGVCSIHQAILSLPVQCHKQSSEDIASNNAAECTVEYQVGPEQV